MHVPHSPPDQYLDGSKVAGEYENKHLDMLLEMDKVVGSLVSSLEERGLAKDTLIIFSSDNGGLGSFHYPNRFLRGHKGQIWEGGHRVPLIMRYDGVLPQGEKRTGHFVGLNDIYATLAEIVGVSIPDRSAQDSMSFAKYAASENYTGDLRKYIGTWDYTRIGNQQHLQSESLRYGSLKAIRHFHPVQRTELFDLNSDLAEVTNIAEDRSNRQILKKMLKKLEQAGPCPRDKEGEFVLRSGNDKGRIVTCDWFELDTRRCKYYVDGELFCNSICGRHHQHICSAVRKLYSEK